MMFCRLPQAFRSEASSRAAGAGLHVNRLLSKALQQISVALGHVAVPHAIDVPPTDASGGALSTGTLGATDAVTGALATGPGDFSEELALHASVAQTTRPTPKSMRAFVFMRPII